MCGIVALLDFSRREVTRDEIRRLRDTMFHRGPDDDGLFVERGVGLGHRRRQSSICRAPDINRCRMKTVRCRSSSTARFTTSVELRGAAPARARVHIRDRYRSDPPPVRGRRRALPRKVPGMFAFAVWDGRRGVCSRRATDGDRFLHHYHDGTTLLLASEIKAILNTPGVARRADLAGADYLYAGRARRQDYVHRRPRAEPGWQHGGTPIPARSR